MKISNARSLVISAFCAVLLGSACSTPAKKSDSSPAPTAIQTPKPSVSSVSDTTGKKDSHALVTCSEEKETRTIAIVTKDPGCEVIYEKSGTPTTVASAKNGTAHCVSIRDRIQGKLASAGWKCAQ